MTSAVDEILLIVCKKTDFFYSEYATLDKEERDAISFDECVCG